MPAGAVGSSCIWRSEYCGDAVLKASVRVTLVSKGRKDNARLRTLTRQRCSTTLWRNTSVTLWNSQPNHQHNLDKKITRIEH